MTDEQLCRSCGKPCRVTEWDNSECCAAATTTRSNDPLYQRGRRETATDVLGIWFAIVETEGCVPTAKQVADFLAELDDIAEGKEPR